jgi:formate dehydrogenase accessory protein FdhD
VTKVARVGIPLVISPAAATHEAVLLAERDQITLCGRVRRCSMTVYSAPWRVI